MNNEQSKQTQAGAPQEAQLTAAPLTENEFAIKTGAQFTIASSHDISIKFNDDGTIDMNVKFTLVALDDLEKGEGHVVSFLDWGRFNTETGGDFLSGTLSTMKTKIATNNVAFHSPNNDLFITTKGTKGEHGRQAAAMDGTAESNSN